MRSINTKSQLSLYMFIGLFYLIIRYYEKRRFNLWIKGNYGDYIPYPVNIFNYTVRYYLRMIKVQAHRWRISHFYTTSKKDNYKINSLKYDIIVKMDNYINRRDSSFDFLNPGKSFKEFDKLLNKYDKTII